MLIQIENNADIIPIVGLGLIILTIYLLFAFYVTRHGDFYKIRRWKAALWVSITSFAVIQVIIVITSVGGIIGNNSSFINNPSLSFGMKVTYIFGLFTSIIKQQLVITLCLIPLLFVSTLGTYHQLKWWLTSDDYLDKIWKDPNKNKKSPLTWL